MKKTMLTLLALCQLCWLSSSFAQLTSVPDGGNKKAVVGERVGITDVTIHYDRPGVKHREGQIYGKLVPVGFANLGFGTSKAAPWRAGANENTTIEFSTDVKVEGQPLPAGTYGLFVAYDPNESTLIFSKNHQSWGSFFYNPDEDALRVKIKPVPNDKSVEWLQYEFTNETDNSAVVALEWEKLIFPFKVEVDLNATQVASFRKELRTDKGFTWESWNQAAQWCLQHNTNLDEALLWADSATSSNFGGEGSFTALSTKAQILEKMGKTEEASALMKKAYPLGNMNELHLYGRRLIGQKKPQEALEVFKMNFTKHPNEFMTNMGMARGYSAVGDYKKALEFAHKAEQMAPEGSKPLLDQAIKNLNEGKDMN